MIVSQPRASEFQRLTPALLEKLRRQIPGVPLLTDPDRLEHYGHDFTESFQFPPEAVALPAAVEEVQTILAFAHEERIPITPRGAGTGVSGGALPVLGGIALSLERMNRIRSIDPRNLTAEVEAGVVVGELQQTLESQGLFYPPDPASRDSCFLGGNLAEDSAGPRSCKYGSTRKWVLGLEAVLADGQLLSTGGANRKDVAGYNLTQLLVGSEGTLAVITAATLRLISRPRHRITLAVPFPRLEEAAFAVEELFLQGFDPAACELMEERSLAAVGRLLPLPAALEGQKALLLLELDGQDRDELLETAAGLGELVERLGSGEVLFAEDEADQRRLWQIRRKIAEAVKAISSFKDADAVVPRGRLVEMVKTTRQVAKRHGLEALCVGHAGDGNLHLLLLQGDLDDETWKKRRDGAELELFQAIVGLGGSITGEHGIGWTQREYLPLTSSPACIELMRGIKKVFDPRGILNPGKVFPDRP